MSEYKKVKGFPILHLVLHLNVKNESKAERVLKRIQKAIDLPIYIDEISHFDKDEFMVFCYLVSEYKKVNDSIVWTLVTLDKIGEEWYIEAPNLKHKAYWKFKGTRLNEWNTFKINGIDQIDFELTNLEREIRTHKVIE